MAPRKTQRHVGAPNHRNRRFFRLSGKARTPRLLALTACASFAMVWVWIAAVPMAFMDPEYPSWRAKQILLHRCDLGEIVVLGDSRAATDILPALLPVPGVNLAVGGGEAIEALATARRMLTCPNPPRRVILSLDPGHFMRPDLFWERSVRYGLVTAADLADLRDATRRTGDTSIYTERHIPGLPDRLRGWLYRARFPSFYFASLAHGGGALRWRRNRHILAATLAARGQYVFGTAPGSDSVAVEGHLPAFQPLPVLDDSFNRLLALLDQRRIEVWFLAMPVNHATWDATRPALRTDFAAYLSAYAARYRHFHVAPDIMPSWPNRYFGDQFCHMNQAGARRFTAWLAQRLQAAPPSTQNDAQNGWFSDTGPEASFNVAPSSKRGS
ncbi:MAG TPA: hypothetical protein VHO91_17660 [Rhodopila sp.]|nr:hypothetical protein [Rhodopila sp.]